jgi:hypothetical protein
MTIDLHTFLSTGGGDYEARVNEELKKKRALHSQELIKSAIFYDPTKPLPEDIKVQIIQMTTERELIWYSSI